MRREDCTFCQIIEGRINSKMIYEDKNVIAFLDIYPISKGHLIVATKNHYKNMEDIPDEDLLKVYKVVKNLAKLIHEKLNVDGYNVLQNNFRAAGQVIDHFHVHIIPRSINDDRFKLKIPRNQPKEKELDEILKLLSN
ncbi:MAG: HIT family protein [Candidatus Heimdallarchaeota archaeon]